MFTFKKLYCFISVLYLHAYRSRPMSFANFVCRQIKTLELNKDIVADIYPKTFDIAECCVNTYEHITSACVMSPDTHGQIKAFKKDIVVLQNTGRCDADRR